MEVGDGILAGFLGTLDCTLRENSRLRVSRNTGALWDLGVIIGCFFFFHLCG